MRSTKELLKLTLREGNLKFKIGHGDDDLYVNGYIGLCGFVSDLHRWNQLREGWELALYEAENPDRMKFFKDTHNILMKYERPVKKYPDGIGILTADYNDLIAELFKYIKENDKNN